MIYHIRKPLRRARGNSFYRDKSHRGNGTYCGADCTDCDISAKAKPHHGFVDETRGLMVCCPSCIQSRNAAEGAPVTLESTEGPLTTGERIPTH